MPLGFFVGGGCLRDVLLPLEFCGFPFVEADDASALFTSVFLLAIDSDPGRSVPNWSFYAKSAVEALGCLGTLSTPLVRCALYVSPCGPTPTGASSSSDSSHSTCAWKT